MIVEWLCLEEVLTQKLYWFHLCQAQMSVMVLWTSLKLNKDRFERVRMLVLYKYIQWMKLQSHIGHFPTICGTCPNKKIDTFCQMVRTSENNVCMHEHACVIAMHVMKALASGCEHLAILLVQACDVDQSIRRDVLQRPSVKSQPSEGKSSMIPTGNG